MAFSALPRHPQGPVSTVCVGPRLLSQKLPAFLAQGIPDSSVEHPILPRASNRSGDLLGVRL